MRKNMLKKVLAYAAAAALAMGILAGPFSPSLTVRAEETDKAEELPAFEYTGEDAYIGPIWEYIQGSEGINYDPCDVMLPAFIIFREDDSDKEDIRVWGNFQIDNYDLRGTTLIGRSGGSYPGLAHLKETKDGYEVTALDLAEDGSNYSASIRRIVGNNRDLLEAFRHMDEGRIERRVDYIRMYAEQTGLEIRAYQDFGWDPVSCIPDEKFVVEYPEIAGKWVSEEVDVTMEITAPDEGNTFDVTIDVGFTDGTRWNYDLFGQYEMSTNTLYYWDGWVTADDGEELNEPADGTLAILEDGSIEWTNADSDPIVLVCSEPAKKQAKSMAAAPAPAPASAPASEPAASAQAATASAATGPSARTGSTASTGGHAFSGAYEPGITEQQAKNIALADADVRERDVIFVRTELNLDDGRWEYEIEFYSGQTEYDYDIDADTGAIISIDRDAEFYTPPVRPTVEAGAVTDQQALEIALQHAGLAQSEISRAKVKKDMDDGRWVFEIEFRHGWKEYDYTIDASTGRILEYDIGD